MVRCKGFDQIANSTLLWELGHHRKTSHWAGVSMLQHFIGLTSQYRVYVSTLRLGRNQIREIAPLMGELDPTGKRYIRLTEPHMVLFGRADTEDRPPANYSKAAHLQPALAKQLSLSPHRRSATDSKAAPLQPAAAATQPAEPNMSTTTIRLSLPHVGCPILPWPLSITAGQWVISNPRLPPFSYSMYFSVSVPLCHRWVRESVIDRLSW